ncbi:MAG: pirin family protein [Rhodospirillales bacterium]|nr:pirin family protein [Rhodospirillales bacterium]
MISVRPAAERGHANFGWLDTRHTFSFGQYYDPRHMGFGALRVINDDRVAPGAGFPMHPHADMEILTYVLEGALAHQDSIGNGAVIRPGEVQRMSAGTGIRHSEFNASRESPVHLLQIWILPERSGLAPGYEQKAIDVGDGLTLLASRDGRDGSVTIHQDAGVFAARLVPDKPARHRLASRRRAWLHVARGDAVLNGITLAAGDGAAVTDESDIELGTRSGGEVLLFDLA